MDRGWIIQEDIIPYGSELPSQETSQHQDTHLPPLGRSPDASQGRPSPSFSQRPPASHVNPWANKDPALRQLSNSYHRGQSPRKVLQVRPYPCGFWQEQQRRSSEGSGDASKTGKILQKKDKPRALSASLPQSRFEPRFARAHTIISGKPSQTAWQETEGAQNSQDPYTTNSKVRFADKQDSRMTPQVTSQTVGDGLGSSPTAVEDKITLSSQGSSNDFASTQCKATDNKATFIGLETSGNGEGGSISSSPEDQRYEPVRDTETPKQLTSISTNQNIGDETKDPAAISSRGTIQTSPRCTVQEGSPIQPSSPEMLKREIPEEKKLEEIADNCKRSTDTEVVGQTAVSEQVCEARDALPMDSFPVLSHDNELFNSTVYVAPYGSMADEVISKTTDYATSTSSEPESALATDTFPVLSQDSYLFNPTIECVPYQPQLETPENQKTPETEEETTVQEQQEDQANQRGPSSEDLSMGEQNNPIDDLENDIKEDCAIQEISDENRTGIADNQTYDVDAKAAVLKGKFDRLPPPKSNIIRVFLSSTFSDMKEERNRLTKVAFPRLRQYCKDHSLEFQVVDMRWGITDDMTDQHLTNLLCLKQIEACQRISMGPNFVVLIGDRYGFLPLPLTILERDWEALMVVCPDRQNDDLELLRRWYRLDSNAIPPHYVLQPISSQIEEFGTKEENRQERRTQAAEEWEVAQTRLRNVLQDLAEKAKEATALAEEQSEFFFASITEREVANGILNVQQPRALCYYRKLQGLEDDLKNSLIRKYVDISNEGEDHHLNQNMQLRLRTLKEEKLPIAVDKDSIRRFEAMWHSNGLCPESHTENEEYLSMLCERFEQDMKKAIQDTLTERASTEEDVLMKEVLHHAYFCQAKCATFCGREEALFNIQCFLEDADASRSPLVIHGPSGCGKTSMMAMVAGQVQSWLGPETVSIVRFLGTSPSSSNIKSTILGIIEQICTVYDMNMPPLDNNSTSLDVFKSFLPTLEECSHSQRATKKPLVLVLDSLDQLSVADGAHSLVWLPDKSLPEHIYIVVSTLPEEHSILSLLQQQITECKNYISLDRLPAETGLQIIDATMSRHRRTLGSEQRALLIELFEKCSRALHLKMLLDDALTWKSYTKVDENMLSTTAEATIHDLFTRMERSYGQKLISYCFSYLTVSNGGLTEVELEDVLSCNDDVLNEVFQYHNPPVPGVVRLPPLILARIHHDIGEYLAERQTDNVTVITWYHRLFFAVARLKYLSDSPSGSKKSFEQQCHSDLADIFLASNGIKRTIHLTQRKVTVDDADRQIAPQPLDVRNLRKLNKLPYFLYHSDDFGAIVNKLKSTVLCNLNWLQTKLNGTNFKTVIDDFKMVAESDREIEMVHGILQLSSSTLEKNPEKLAVEFASRLEHSLPHLPLLDNLVCEALKVLHGEDEVTLIPVFPCLPAPNGILRTTFLGPTHIFSLNSESLAVVWGPHTGLQVWNMKTFEFEHYLCDLSRPHADGIRTSTCGRYVFHTKNNCLYGWDVKSGRQILNTAAIPGSLQTSDSHIDSQRLAPLTCVALSNSKNLAAVRINYPNLLLEGKSLIVIQTEDGCIVTTMVSTVFGERLTNVLFVDDDQRVVVTQSQSNQPSVVKIFESTTGAELWKIDLNPKFAILPTLLKPCVDSSQLVIGLRPADFAVIDYKECSLVYSPDKPTAIMGRFLALHPLRSGLILGLCFDIMTKLTHLKEFSPDGNTESDLVSSSSQPKFLLVSDSETLAFVGYVVVGTIDIWDLEHKVMLLELGAHATGTNRCIYDETSGTLFSSCLDYTLKVWRLGELLEKKKASCRAVSNTSKKETSSKLEMSRAQTEGGIEENDEERSKEDALSEDDRESKSSDQERKPCGLEKTVRGATPDVVDSEISGRQGVTNMALTTDGKYLVTCHDDSQPVIRDTETGHVLLTCETPLGSSGTPVAYPAVDNTFLVGLTRVSTENNNFQNVVRCWDMKTGKVKVVQGESVHGDVCSVMQDGLHMVVVGKGQTETRLYLIGLPNMEVLMTHTSTRVPTRLSSVLVTSDKRFAILVEQWSAVQVWSLDNDNVDKVIKVITRPLAVALLDNHTLVAGTTYANLLAFDLENLDYDIEETTPGRIKLVPEKHSGEILVVTVSDHLLATGSADRTTKVVDLRKKEVVTRISGHTDKVTCVDLSPSEDILVTGSRDKTIRVWKCSSGQQLADFNAYDDVFDVKLCNQARTVAALVHMYGARRLVMLAIHAL